MIIYNFIKYLVMYIQYYKALRTAYKDENLVKRLGETLDINFKVDWIGRIYGIFNPNLKNGKFDVNNPIYSYNERGLDTEDFVKVYIMTKLNAIQTFVDTNTLFELVGYEIRRLDNYDNFLFIIKPLPYDNLVKWTKLLPIPLTIIVAAIAVLIIFL